MKINVLSIRQPWAWLILNAGKDIENRTWQTKFTGKILVHAGQTMTRADYEAAVIFCSGLELSAFSEKFVSLPDYDELKRECGGIVGSVEITGCVSRSNSPWFCGPYGFTLKNPVPAQFVKMKGKLGFFQAEVDLIGV